MGFFKDFKDDFSQAMNEIIPGEEPLEEEDTLSDDLVVNTLEEEVDVESELSKLDGLLEQVTKQEEAKAATRQPVEPVAARENVSAAQSVLSEKLEKELREMRMNTMQEENRTMNETPVNVPVNNATPVSAPAKAPVSDEASVITAGTVIRGDISSTGSLDIQGTINGNVECNGKLVVTGTVNGNSNSSEFFADAAKIEGEVVSTGTVKIGLGSVIIGNVTSSSAVIAGAIKGDIDVQGPVVVDTSAVVMGNIKSRSVQINNGAVIEGFCSQCYSDVDVNELFESKKGTM
ncbi:MAG: polymer-forming cytoskeletal protein [Roseburia sp.]|uniref:polymer-forming cytoskeletal protein n=1 Tax=Roseburia sp. 831b TaxID=1261635 RepID=UPI000951D091|nr:polymer-forming cytoskeletal protein [Roseburia sp. 831b]MCI5918587.1 polymer-forming cytoskeletal protein [Roseburia sp.]MDY5883538.1 polymer-forming cytoskeletal protein [Roseburia sp.]WVK73878.1 polymer-forming cytoskeletal protein [Roseburia sp. 831b]